MVGGISISHVYLHLGISLLLWIMVILAVCIDLWDGVYTAKVMHRRIHSHKLRVTIRKIGEYWRFILFGFIADSIGILFPFWALPYLSILICLGCIYIEFKSVREHAKKRKSHAADLPQVIKSIVNCLTEHEALDVLKNIQDMVEESNAKFTER